MELQHTEAQKIQFQGLLMFCDWNIKYLIQFSEINIFVKNKKKRIKIQTKKTSKNKNYTVIQYRNITDLCPH